MELIERDENFEIIQLVLPKPWNIEEEKCMWKLWLQKLDDKAPLHWLINN